MMHLQDLKERLDSFFILSLCFVLSYSGWVFCMGETVSYRNLKLSAYSTQE